MYISDTLQADGIVATPISIICKSFQTQSCYGRTPLVDPQLRDVWELACMRSKSLKVPSVTNSYELITINSSLSGLSEHMMDEKKISYIVCS